MPFSSTLVSPIPNLAPKADTPLVQEDRLCGEVECSLSVMVSDEVEEDGVYLVL